MTISTHVAEISQPPSHRTVTCTKRDPASPCWPSLWLLLLCGEKRSPVKSYCPENICGNVWSSSVLLRGVPEFQLNPGIKLFFFFPLNPVPLSWSLPEKITSVQRRFVSCCRDGREIQRHSCHYREAPRQIGCSARPWIWCLSGLRTLHQGYVSTEAAANTSRTGVVWGSSPVADSCLKDFKTSHWAALRMWGMVGISPRVNEFTHENTVL